VRVDPKRDLEETRFAVRQLARSNPNQFHKHSGRTLNAFARLYLKQFISVSFGNKRTVRCKE
jgi:hypothetical protein